MATEEKVTYCRICEPLCGMVATVEDGRVTKLRPDADHPLSDGFACPKGIAMTEVQNDPDRVPAPAAPQAPTASFERVTWDEALDEIGERLRRDPSSATAATRSAGTWATPAPSPTRTRSGSRASSTRSARRTTTPPPRRTSPTASPRAALLYGSPFLVPIPDLARTDFLLIVGANPLVSHGERDDRAAGQGPAARDHRARRARRRRRPAALGDRRAFEHLAVNPDSDAWLLLSLLEVIFAEGLEDRGAIARQSPGSRPCASWSPRTRRRRPRRPPASRPTRSASSPATSLGAERRGGLRAHRLLPRAQRHPRLLPARRAQRRQRQPRPRGRGDVRRPADRLRAGRGPARLRHLRARCARGSAACPTCSAQLPASLMAKEITTPGDGPDAGAVRLRRQPGALGAQRRRARGGAGRARALGRDRPLRHRHRPPRRLRPPGDDVATSARTSRSRSSPCSRRRSSR